MILSVREIQARFTEAATAAARGERVIVTQDGLPFVELVPAQSDTAMDLDRAASLRQELGLDGLTVSIGSDFDDPAFSRQVLGIAD